MEPILKIEKLSVVFDTDEGEVRAVDQVSFSIGAGEAFGLVGESGCGKSVTSMCIPRLLSTPPARLTSGRILFQGQDLLTMPLEELRKIRGNQIGVIFQEPMTALSPLCTIGFQLAEVVRLHREMSQAAIEQLCLEWLRRVGIGDPARIMKSYPFELSGGMRQRVMIAMALILEPKLVIADEPTTALDVTIQAQILQLMKQVVGKEAALLLITHDMGIVWEMCQKMAVMYASRIVETGSVQAIFEHPRHPYTAGLMNSIPAMNPGVRRLPHIPGQVPSLRRLPSGCLFAPRCPYAMEKCGQAVPVLDETGVACCRR